MIPETNPPITVEQEADKTGKPMTTALLNLPHETRIMRRYMCSSLAPNYLFPPQELIALGGIVREWKKDEVHLIDAIAENLDEQGVDERLHTLQPQLVITISGFESFEKDMEQIRRVKKHFPKTKIVLFGHYPTQFPAEILEKVPVDYIILGEPDLVFSQLYDCLKNNLDLREVKGIAYKRDGEIIIQQGEGRIPD